MHVQVTSVNNVAMYEHMKLIGGFAKVTIYACILYYLTLLVKVDNRGGLGSQTGRGKNIKAALLPMAAKRAERVTGGVQGPASEPRWGENLGFYAILGVGERGFSDDFLKQKS